MARSRNSRGQFTKRRSSGGATASASVALAPRRSTSVRRRGGGGVPRGGRRGRRGSSGGTSNRVRFGVTAAGFGIGYINKNYSSTVQKVPAIKGSHIFTAGVASHFLLKPRSGSWLDHATTAACVIGGYEIGSSGIIGDSDTPMWGG